MQNIKDKIYETIFEADTRAGKWFDIGLLLLIFISIISVILESVPEYDKKYSNVFSIIEISASMLFTIEYLLRIYCIKNPFKYIFSFIGIIDFLAFAPSLFGIATNIKSNFVFLRVIRLLRVFRILKLSRYLMEEETLLKSLKISLERIFVFLFLVIIIVLLLASVMYIVEPSENGFSSIPQSIYWTIVTITTVGYGDITPVTALGKIISSIIMLLGYAIIAVPTGIITAEMVFKKKQQISTQVCPNCLQEGHDKDAIHCKFCGSKL